MKPAASTRLATCISRQACCLERSMMVAYAMDATSTSKGRVTARTSLPLLTMKRQSKRFVWPTPLRSNHNLTLFEQSWKLFSTTTQQPPLHPNRHHHLRHRRMRVLQALFPEQDHRVPGINKPSEEGGSGTDSSFYWKGQMEPYDHGEDSWDAYVQKASLSPWVPMPEAAIRAMLDLAQLQETDVHVDLGCGDGRVNFLALDAHHVATSIGMDVDARILQAARTRLSKRHPPPENVRFIEANLDDERDPAWQIIHEQATVITMYFATPGLVRLRPRLEEALFGRQNVRILTCEYEMPGWDAYNYQVVLGMPLYLYEWGKTTDQDNGEAEEDYNIFRSDNRLQQQQEQEQLDLQFKASKQTLGGANVIDRTRPFHLRGFDLGLFAPPDDDDDDDDWSDEDDPNDCIKEDGEQPSLDGVDTSSNMKP